MLFNSWQFLLFFVLVYGLYATTKRSVRAQNVLLLVASYFFYGWWDWRFLGLLALSTAVDYIAAKRIRAAREQDDDKLAKRWLLLSLGSNLGVLGTFKYLGFFIDSAAHLLSSMGFDAHPPLLEIVLPVGISFYTFQTLAYSIDVYRGRVDPEESPVVFALYVCFFPQLVAGPIERAQTLLPQLRSPRTITTERVYEGALLIFIGLVRKVGIADTVAPVVDKIFDAPGDGDSVTLLAGVVLFALQIYGDFSGYSAMARGVSRLLGIELMENFRQPYFSTNITLFWRRWHISLSTWLRDYLYIPLGGNRGPKWFVYRNLMLTMLLGGLWHGASWTFVVWGGVHGVALAAHKLWTRARKITDDERRPFSLRALPWQLGGWLLTSTVVLVAWVFFRAKRFDQAFSILEGITAWRSDYDFKLLDMVPYQLGPAELALWMAIWVLVIDIPQYRHRCQTAMLRWPWPVRSIVYAAFVLLLVSTTRGASVPFLYFQF